MDGGSRNHRAFRGRESPRIPDPYTATQVPFLPETFPEIFDTLHSVVTIRNGSGQIPGLQEGHEPEIPVADVVLQPAFHEGRNHQGQRVVALLEFAEQFVEAGEHGGMLGYVLGQVWIPVPRHEGFLRGEVTLGMADQSGQERLHLLAVSAGLDGGAKLIDDGEKFLMLLVNDLDARVVAGVPNDIHNPNPFHDENTGIRSGAIANRQSNKRIFTQETDS